MFGLERDLEDYLETCLPLLGQDLLIIGRQVHRDGARIDLLAIDAAGVIHIIELKLHEAEPDVIPQVLRYRQRIKQMNRGEIIRHVADGRLKIDLVEAFQRHFGRPLPEVVNESPAVMIIAASIHRDTADCILELLDEGYPLATFRYVVGADGFSLTPCCRDAQDVHEGLHVAEAPPVPRSTRIAQTHRQPGYQVPVDPDIRWFWSTQAQRFGDIVRFSDIHQHYEDWARAHEAEGVRLQQMGQFARQLSAIVKESSEWRRVYVSGSDVAAAGASAGPLSVKPYRALGYFPAYQQNPVGDASGLRDTIC